MFLGFLQHAEAVRVKGHGELQKTLQQLEDDLGAIFKKFGSQNVMFGSFMPANTKMYIGKLLKMVKEFNAVEPESLHGKFKNTNWKTGEILYRDKIRELSAPEKSFNEKTDLSNQFIKDLHRSTIVINTDEETFNSKKELENIKETELNSEKCHQELQKKAETALNSLLGEEAHEQKRLVSQMLTQFPVRALLETFEATEKPVLFKEQQDDFDPILSIHHQKNTCMVTKKKDGLQFDYTFNCKDLEVMSGNFETIIQYDSSNLSLQASVLLPFNCKPQDINQITAKYFLNLNNPKKTNV